MLPFLVPFSFFQDQYFSSLTVSLQYTVISSDKITSQSTKGIIHPYLFDYLLEAMLLGSCHFQPSSLPCHFPFSCHCELPCPKPALSVLTFTVAFLFLGVILCVFCLCLLLLIFLFTHSSKSLLSYSSPLRPEATAVALLEHGIYFSAYS